MISAMAACRVVVAVSAESSPRRSSPTRREFRWAWRSPRIESGIRVLARMTARSPSCSSPPRHSLTGGTCSPSWKKSDTPSTAWLPGRIPPTSVWCRMLAAKPISPPPFGSNAGWIMKKSGKWPEPRNGLLKSTTSPGCSPSRPNSAIACLAANDIAPMWPGL